VAAARQLLGEVLAHRGDDTPGIGIDYRENDHPPEDFAEVYALARQAGLRTTAHAGEFGLPWVNVQTAIERLQVDRIDHGYTIVDHPPLVARARERGLVFTVVPTNSYYLRTLPRDRWAADHPIRAMLAAGLKLHPNTDDPTLHQVTPTEAWAMMVEQFGATWTQVEGFVDHGIEAAWVDESTRAGWRSGWAAEIAAQRP
jgi:adenosine deaminase